MGAHHEVPFGIWLATADENAPIAHWYILQDPSRVDINRNATKAVLATGEAQAVHEHIPGELCKKECKVLVFGSASEAEE